MEQNKLIVVTVSGKEEIKENCRKMNGIYYLKGDVLIENSGECYLINGRYYKYNTGYIIYDHSVKSYILKKEFNNVNNTEKGVVGFNEDNSPIFGAFTISNYADTPIVVIDLSTYYCISEDLLINNFLYLENLEDGMYYNRFNMDSYKFILPVSCSSSYKHSLSYDSRGITKKVSDKYDKQYKPIYHKFFENEKSDITKGLSFGLEFETTHGMVPERICNKLGLIPLRDGSISGLEYVTIPLEGNKGIQTVIDTLKELDRRTKYDNDCSLHLHVGNIPRTEEFFIAIYKILFLLQDSMYSMFPIYKKENYGVKRKHYTKPLPLDTMLSFDTKIEGKKDIKRNFENLYNFLSMNQDYNNAGGKLESVEYHPSDPRGNSKWNIRTRYHWVNLIPLLFGNKQTIEFRVHTPTYDCNKVINYMLICFSIIDYTIKNQDKILKDFSNFVNITLNDIVFDTYYNDFSEKGLIEDIQYYSERRKSHFYEKTRTGDFIADERDFIYKNRYINWNNDSSPSRAPLPKSSKSSAFIELERALDRDLRFIGQPNEVIFNGPPVARIPEEEPVEEGLNLIMNDIVNDELNIMDDE